MVSDTDRHWRPRTLSDVLCESPDDFLNTLPPDTFAVNSP